MMMVPAVATVGILLVATDAENWWQAVMLSASVVAALVAIERWTADRIGSVGPACLAITATIWLVGTLATDSHTAFFGLTVVGSVVVPELPRHRGAAAVGLTAGVAVIGATRLLVSHDVPVDLPRYVLIPAGVAVVGTAAMFANQTFYRIMEQSRERDAELAVARERVRFASDLHDIQGHTLHVVKLKIALAQKLVRADADRAEAELREIHDLVGDTITQTKELAYAQRRLNLAAELENAKNLFEAAGIRVRVHRDAEPDDQPNELLGQVLRETTTNILRHAQAKLVRITLSRSGIAIVNDGAPDAPRVRLRGLATLSERVADHGGELTVEHADGRFVTAAAFPDEGDR